MKFKFTICMLILLLCYLSAQAIDKSEFDINMSSEDHSLQKTTGFGLTGEESKNNISEITLIQGGYFTIGTNDGVSSSSLDDHCGITFGHPYALTSYPILKQAGEWKKLEAIFNIRQSSPQVHGDSLILKYETAGKLHYEFCIAPNLSGNSITISSELKNLSTQSQSAALGLMFDPAIGRKGDGWVKLPSHIIKNDTTLTATPNLEVIERIGVADGMRLAFDFTGDNPAAISIQNWNQDQATTADNYPLIKMLYDLMLNIQWPEQTIDAGATITKAVTINLLEPDYSSPLFMRWDLPSFLSLENNMLFPRSFASMIEIVNQTTASYTNCTLSIDAPEELFGESNHYNLGLPADNSSYHTIRLNSKELYEDQVAATTINLHRGNQLIDSILRHVYIPAVPLSDTGLVCTIDTVITSQYPEIKFSFEVQVEKTGQRIFNLASENLFLYENETRIESFEFGKDTTGGVSKADVVFVLDCSGSMGDDIRAVRENINEFADSLVARGVDLRLGVVAFSTHVDDVHDLTSDIELFKSWLTAIDLWGGRENSLAALWRASELSLRPDAKHTIVWITDENYPVAPEINLTVQETVNQLLAREITVHSISEPGHQTEWCNPIIEPTSGLFFDIRGNFRDILMKISRMKASNKYMLSYDSPNGSSGTNSITLEIHYAGRGGFGHAEYTIPGLHKVIPSKLSCFPNPFNPTIQIAVDLRDHLEGELEIYNMLGQRVRTFPLNGLVSNHIVQWDARDMFSREVAAGTYFVRLNTTSADGKRHLSQVNKILYLK